MHTESSLSRLAVVTLLMLPLVSCSYFDQLSAMRTFREGNVAYGRGDYAGAVEHYEEIVEILDQVTGDQLLNQQLTATYFYVANFVRQPVQASVGGVSPKTTPTLRKPSSTTRLPPTGSWTRT